MYVLFIFLTIGLFRTLIFHIYVYGLNEAPPAYHILFWEDKTLVMAIEDRFEEDTKNSESEKLIEKGDNSSVRWDYFIQQGCFLNSILSEVVTYNEEILHFPYVTTNAVEEKKVVQNNNEANHVYDLGDGYLVNIIEKRDNTELVNRICDFKDFLDGQGIKYIFFLAPGKISRLEDSQIPFFMDNNSNKNADDLLEKLNSNDIYTYDMRDDFESDGKYREYFYLNDHHWNNKATLKAADISSREICKLANLNYASSLYELSNYDKYQFGNRFYGSLAKSDSKKSDYILYLPKYETSLSFASVHGGDFGPAGTMEENFCRWEDIYDHEREDRYLYGCFGIGDTGIVRNNLAKNNYKILVLSDSYAYSYVPYLALQFKYVIRINNRAYQESIKDFIIQEKPDMVIQINDQDNNKYDLEKPEKLWEFD